MNDNLFWRQKEVRNHFDNVESLLEKFREVAAQQLKIYHEFITTPDFTGDLAESAKKYINEMECSMINLYLRARSELAEEHTKICQEFKDEVDTSSEAVIYTSSLEKIIKDFDSYHEEFDGVEKEVDAIMTKLETVSEYGPFTKPNPYPVDNKFREFVGSAMYIGSFMEEGFVPTTLKNFRTFDYMHKNDINNSVFMEYFETVKKIREEAETKLGRRNVRTPQAYKECEIIIDPNAMQDLNKEVKCSLEQMLMNADMLQVWYSCCLTETDRQFLELLMQGTAESYEAAFNINPNDLSPAMALVMYQYSKLLVKSGDEELLKAFMNGLIKSEGHMYYGEYETSTYLEKYLELFTVASYTELEGMAALLATLDPQSSEYAKLREDYEDILAMVGFYSSFQYSMDNLRNLNQENITPEITEITFDDHEARYVINHYSNRTGERVDEVIFVDSVMNGENYSGKLTQSELQALQQQQETAMVNFLSSIISDVGISVLATAMPEVAVGVGLLAMLLNGKAGTIRGLTNISQSQILNTHLKYGNIVVSDAINSYLSFIHSGEALSGKEKDVYMSWFGMGIYTEYSSEDGSLTHNGFSYVGACNPDVLARMNLWEQEGLGGWLDNWGSRKDEDGNLIIHNEDDLWEEVQKSKYGFSDEVLEDCHTLIYGGDNMFEDMTMTRFINAVEALTQAAKLDEEALRVEFLSDLKG